MVKRSDSKKLDLLGIPADNYTVREALLRFDTYVGSTVLNIIETVSIKQLLSLGEHPAVDSCLRQADLCIVGEGEILLELGIDSPQRMREIRDQDFLYEVLNRMGRAKKRIFLIAMTQDTIGQMKEAFLEKIPQFQAVGSFSMEEGGGDMEGIVNEINGATPDIVISALDSPMEEEFILSHKDKIGTGIWYGIGAFPTGGGRTQVGRRIIRLALRGRLHLAISKYRKSKNEEK